MNRPTVVLPFILLLALALSLMTGQTASTYALLSPLDATATPDPALPPTITIDVDGTIELNQPVSVTISVTTHQAIADLQIGLDVSPASAQIRGEKFWPVGDVPANHTVRVTSTVVFPTEAEYLIVAGVHNPMGMAYNTSLRLAVTAHGATINVQPEPAVPAVVSQVMASAASPQYGQTVARLDAEPNSTASGQVTLRGTVEFESRNGTVRPLRQARIEVWDWDDPNNVSLDDLLWTGVTDEVGHYVTGPIDNVDEDGTRRDVYVLFSTTTDPSSVSRREVTRVNPWIPYSFWTRSTEVIAWDVTDGALEYNPFLGSAVTGYQAAWLFDDEYRTWNYLRFYRSDLQPWGVSIRWTPTVREYSPCLEQSCYVPGLGPNGVFIQDSDVTSPDYIVHELGHAYRHWIMGIWFFADVPEYLACRSHWMFTSSNAACAFSEGWSNFLALGVNGDQCFDYRSHGPCEPGADDLEAHGRGDGFPVGDTVEGRVTGALWDMIDIPVDGTDWQSVSFWGHYTLLYEGDQEFQARDFYDHWMTRWGASNPVTFTFHQNTINYGIQENYLPLVLNEATSAGQPAPLPTPGQTPAATATPGGPFDSPIPTPTSAEPAS